MGMIYWVHIKPMTTRFSRTIIPLKRRSWTREKGLAKPIQLEFQDAL
jgi:hypothetical protein